MDSTDYLAGAQIRRRRLVRRDPEALPARQPSSLRNVDDPRCIAAGCGSCRTVDAQNAPTAPWKPQNGFHKLPQPFTLFFLMKKTIKGTGDPGPGRVASPHPGAVFSRAVERFAEQHVSRYPFEPSIAPMHRELFVIK
jgi:hypothetical protein